MRRNLVGKKQPQQFKVKWTSTAVQDLITPEDVKAHRDLYSDFSSFYTWSQIADGALQQLTEEDWLVLNVAHMAQRQYTQSSGIVLGTAPAAGSGSLDRMVSAYRPISGTAGTATAPFQAVPGAGNIFPAVPNGDGGQSITMSWDGVGTPPKLVLNNYQPGPDWGEGPESVDYYRIRMRMWTALQNPNPLDVYIEGQPVDSILSYGEFKYYTFYGRGTSNGANVELVMSGSGLVEFDYVYFDMADTSFTGNTPTDKTIVATNFTNFGRVGVRVGGEVAETAFTRVLLASDDVYMRGGSGIETGAAHAGDYVRDVDTSSCLALTNPSQIWSSLRVDNPNIPEELDPTAEWFVGLPINERELTYNANVDIDIRNGNYTTADAWVAENGWFSVMQSAAVSGRKLWNGTWKRLYEMEAEGDRIPSPDSNLGWYYEDISAVEANDDEEATEVLFSLGVFPDSPNGFTLDALGLQIGIGMCYETADRADGYDPDSGTAASRGERGQWILTELAGPPPIDQDFRLEANYFETYSSRTLGFKGKGCPQSCERRVYTYIVEDGQDCDYDFLTFSDTFADDLWTNSNLIHASVN